MKYAFTATFLAGILAFATGAEAQDTPKIGVYFSTPEVQRLSGPNNPFQIEVVPGDEASRIDYNGFNVETFDFAGAIPGWSPSGTDSSWNNSLRWTGSGGNEMANGGVYTTTGRSFHLIADQYGGEYTSGGSPSGANQAYLGLFDRGGSNPSNYPDGVADITFADPLSYFGFFWTAGNPSNQVKLFGRDNANNEIVLETFDTERLLDILGPNVAPSNPNAKTVRTLGGLEIQGADYYGQPFTGQNTGQAYAFLHFIANGEENQITRIELSNVETGSAFESDNHTTAFWNETGQIYMPLTTDELVIVQPIPEPSTYALLGAAAGIGAWLRRRKR